MSAAGTQPVSAANLAAALGGDASGGIGGDPICVDNLEAVLGSGVVTLETLWECDPASPVHSAVAPFGYDVYIVDIEMRNDDTNAVIGDTFCVAVDGEVNQDDYMYWVSSDRAGARHVMTVYGAAENPPVFRPQQSSTGIGRYYDRFLRIRGGNLR